MSEILKPPFETIGLIIRQHSNEHIDEIRAICQTLKKFGDLMIYPLDENYPLNDCPVTDIDTIRQQADLAVSIGGDGTLLSAARLLVDHDIPLVGINLGRLDFLADVTMNELATHINEIFSGHYSVEKRFLLQGEIINQGRQVEIYNAMNDIVLHSYNTTSMIEFEVYSDDRLINRQRADGLIVSTPTGSTAYALSGGGPIMHPALDALALVPISPHTLSNRPIVLPSDKRIEIRLSRSDMKGQLSFDGQNPCMINTGDSIFINRYDKQITLLHPANYDYFEILRAKLNWSNQP